jgi:hypothetical protein
VLQHDLLYSVRITAIDQCVPRIVHVSVDLDAALNFVFVSHQLFGERQSVMLADGNLYRTLTQKA